MAYKNDIGRKLKIAKYSRTSRTYELKHEVNDEIKCIQKLKSCVFKKPINSLNIMSIHQIENLYKIIILMWILLRKKT